MILWVVEEQVLPRPPQKHAYCEFELAVNGYQDAKAALIGQCFKVSLLRVVVPDEPLPSAWMEYFARGIFPGLRFERVRFARGEMDQVTEVFG